MNSKKDRLYQRIFRQVIATYQVFKSSNGLNNFGGMKNVEEMSDVSSTYYRAVRPTPLDFICDVDLQIENTLDITERSFILIAFLDNNPQADEKLRSFLGSTEYKKIKKVIQIKLGKKFYHHKLFPIKRYFKTIL